MQNKLRWKMLRNKSNANKLRRKMLRNKNNAKQTWKKNVAKQKCCDLKMLQNKNVAILKLSHIIHQRHVIILNYSFRHFCNF